MSFSSASTLRVVRPPCHAVSRFSNKAFRAPLLICLSALALNLVSTAHATTATVAASATSSPSTPVAASAAANPNLVAQHYARLVYANYSDTLAAASDLQAAIAEFVANPSAAGLQKARSAWLAAREFYGQTEAFRFYGGPIDGKDGPEGRLNAWPMDEAYVDAVLGKPTAGMIQNPKFAINKTNLLRANERGGEENVSTGWHAIEFLLWGQDQDENGPGQRNFADFVDGNNAHATRRRQYLSVVTALLVEDLYQLTQAWQAGKPGNYRARFERGGRESVRKMIVGLGSLSRGELAGERMEVALNSQDQEDEHSCFSDNTHRDIVANATGINNVWLGQYRQRDGSVLQGPGLRDLVAASNPTLADQTTAQLALSLNHAQAIPAPFDRAIIKGAAGRAAVEQTVSSLVAQSKLLVQAASAVGISKLTLAQP